MYIAVVRPFGVPNSGDTIILLVKGQACCKSSIMSAECPAFLFVQPSNDIR